MLEWLFCLLVSLVWIAVDCFAGWNLILRCVMIRLVSFGYLIIIWIFVFRMSPLYNDYTIILGVKPNFLIGLRIGSTYLTKIPTVLTFIAQPSFIAAILTANSYTSHSNSAPDLNYPEELTFSSHITQSSTIYP